MNSLLKGRKEGGAGEGVRTVSPQEFDRVKDELMKLGAVPTGDTYGKKNEGVWYTIPGVDGKFGVRNSESSGESLDFNLTNYGYPKQFRIHQK